MTVKRWELQFSRGKCAIEERFTIITIIIIIGQEGETKRKNLALSFSTI